MLQIKYLDTFSILWSTLDYKSKTKKREEKNNYWLQMQKLFRKVKLHLETCSKKSVIFGHVV